MSGTKEIPVQELNVSQLNQLSQQLEQVYNLGDVTTPVGHVHTIAAISVGVWQLLSRSRSRYLWSTVDWVTVLNINITHLLFPGRSGE